MQQKIHLIFNIHGPTSWIQPTEDCKYFLKIVSIEDCEEFSTTVIYKAFMLS